MKKLNEEDGLIDRLLRPVNPTVIIILGVYTAIWGFWLANPWWHAFDRAPLYSEMEELMPEFYWGCIAIVAGIAIMYGAFRPSYRSLVVGASVAFIHWLTIALFYFAGDWQNTGGITSLTFAVYSGFLYLNLRVNFKKGGRTITELMR